MAEVIRRVYEKGGKFDAWQEHFDFQIWLDAFQETGLDPAFYAHRQRSLDERLPWDHIDIGVQKSFLQEDYKWSKEGKTRPDCREQCYACGVLSAYNQPRRMHPGEHWMCPEVRSSGHSSQEPQKGQ
ncbi:MAG: hypothetical protein KGY46_11230 [Anaerolineales bacterium]|nr:hypothetical protein [Anaerolineales bacterium]